MRDRNRNRFVPRPDALEGRALMSADPTPYDIGSPKLQDIWVDPVHGNDDNSGLSRDKALKSIAEAWLHIAPFQTLATARGTGYRIQLTAGDYAHNMVEDSGYMGDRQGTRDFPIIFNAADGPGTAVIHAQFDLEQNSYVYLNGLSFVADPYSAPGGDMLRINGSNHILVRSCTFNGMDGTTARAGSGITATQSQFVYVESADIGGVTGNGIDLSNVQGGQVINSRLHDLGGQAIVFRDGTSDVALASNTVISTTAVGPTAPPAVAPTVPTAPTTPVVTTPTPRVTAPILTPRYTPNLSRFFTPRVQTPARLPVKPAQLPRTQINRFPVLNNKPLVSRNLGFNTARALQLAASRLALRVR